MILQIETPSKEWMEEKQLKFGELTTADKLAYLEM